MLSPLEKNINDMKTVKPFNIKIQIEILTCYPNQLPKQVMGRSW